MEGGGKRTEKRERRGPGTRKLGVGTERADVVPEWVRKRETGTEARMSFPNGRGNEKRERKEQMPGQGGAK